MEDVLKNSRPLIDKDVHVYSHSDLPVKNNAELLDAFAHLLRIIENRPKSIIVEVNTYRKYVPLLIKSYCFNSDLIQKSLKQVERSLGAGLTNANKHWTDKEDEALIEMACNPKATMSSLSITFGRTPAAISSRITTLVGRKRLSQSIAGRFIGYIDGNKSDAEIVGTVYKEGQV